MIFKIIKTVNGYEKITTIEAIDDNSYMVKHSCLDSDNICPFCGETFVGECRCKMISYSMINTLQLNDMIDMTIKKAIKDNDKGIEYRIEVSESCYAFK